MSMEAMAAEFPDIYQQFLDPQPSPISDAKVGSDNVDSAGYWSMCSSNIAGSKGIVHDSNKNQKFQLPSGQTSRATYSSVNPNITGNTKTSSTNALNGCVLTTGIQPDGSFRNFSEENNSNEGDANSSPLEFADIDDILATLELLDSEPSTNSQLDLAKSAYGCQWTDSFMCPHGDSCPFITQFLGLADFLEPAAVSSQPPRVTSVVVLRQTPNGLIKLQESLMPLGQEEVKRLQAMTPQEQVRHLGLNTAQLRQENTKQVISNTSSSTLQLREQGGQFARPGNTAQYNMTQYKVPMSNQTTYSTGKFSVPASQGQYPAASSTNAQYTSLSTSNIKYRSAGSVPYRPPPNAVLVKVPTSVLQTQSSYQCSFPTPSPSPPAISALSPPNPKYPLLCSECDTQFHDSKSLVKHTRNQHQVYQCNKCGEETVGYYRMASHTKKNHSKEPAFFCQCGRNFSEKRGLTKHQNSCSFYNPM